MLPTIAHALAETTLLGDRVSQPLPHADMVRRQTLRTHRVCAPEHAAYVRAHCLTDPRVLPRWHQLDRGRGNAHRGHHVFAPEGAYAGIPAWRSRTAFLGVATLVLREHAAVLARHQVSLELMDAYLRVRTGYVRDQQNGRRCIVRPKVLATVLDCAQNTVYRCQRVARAIGLEVVVMAGRMLTEAESRACRARGSSQRGLSTEVAFTVPRPHAALVDLVRPTRGRASTSETSRHSSPTHAARSEKTGAAPPRRQRHRPNLPLARQLVGRLAWLQGESPGRCAPSLARFARAQQPWTATDIEQALADDALRSGRTRAISPDQIRTRPSVVLAALLRRLDPIADHPSAPAFTEPAPCGHPDCDGHGWIQLSAHTVAKCPRCPSTVRRDSNSEQHDGDLTHGDPFGEPPF